MTEKCCFFSKNRDRVLLYFSTLWFHESFLKVGLNFSFFYIMPMELNNGRTYLVKLIFRKMKDLWYFTILNLFFARFFRLSFHMISQLHVSVWVFYFLLLLLYIFYVFMDNIKDVHSHDVYYPVVSCHGNWILIASQYLYHRKSIIYLFLNFSWNKCYQVIIKYQRKRIFGVW